VLTSTDLCDWFTQKWPSFATPPESSVVFQPGPFLNVMPDRLVTVTVSGGAGTYGEEQYEDRPTFQLRTRGAQGSEQDAQNIAYALDQFLRVTLYPVTTPAGTLIKVVDRTGGQPTYLPGTPDEGLRYELTCNYIAVVGIPFGS